MSGASVRVIDTSERVSGAREWLVTMCCVRLNGKLFRITADSETLLNHVWQQITHGYDVNSISYGLQDPDGTGESSTSDSEDNLNGNISSFRLSPSSKQKLEQIQDVDFSLVNWIEVQNSIGLKCKEMMTE